MQHEDQKYVDALMNNDPALLKELYEKFSGSIKRMVIQNNGSEADAGDVFQDALVSIYRRVRSGNFVLTCPFEAFLYTVCKCRWLKELAKRKQNRVTNSGDEEYMKDEDSFKFVEEIQLMEARNSLISEKIEELGESCRQLLRISWSGKSMDEVARMLNVSYGYARKKKSQCMAKLIMLVKRSSAYNSLKS